MPYLYKSDFILAYSERLHDAVYPVTGQPEHHIHSPGMNRVDENVRRRQDRGILFLKSRLRPDKFDTSFSRQCVASRLLSNVPCKVAPRGSKGQFS